MFYVTLAQGNNRTKCVPSERIIVLLCSDDNNSIHVTTEQT